MSEPIVPDVVIEAIYNFCRPSLYEEAEEYIRQYMDGHASRGDRTFPPDADPGALFNICCAVSSGNFDRLRKPERSRFEDMLYRMRWSSDRCWFAQVGTMTVGIEPDGYIHS